MAFIIAASSSIELIIRLTFHIMLNDFCDTKFGLRFQIKSNPFNVYSEPFKVSRTDQYLNDIHI